MPSWTTRPYGTRSDEGPVHVTGLAYEAAGIADRAARKAAWEMIRASTFAGHFRDVDATQFAPADVGAVREQLPATSSSGSTGVTRRNWPV